MTASFHNEADSLNTARGNSGDGGGNARGDWEVEADMGFQELAALQLVSAIFAARECKMSQNMLLVAVSYDLHSRPTVRERWRGLVFQRSPDPRNEYHEL